MKTYRIRLAPDLLRELLHLHHPYTVLDPIDDASFKCKGLRGYEILIGDETQPGHYGADPTEAILVTHAAHTRAEIVPC